jgi:signal transduction histidine kinase
LLAALRYRLEPRLAAAGIELEWAVDEVAPVKRLDAQAMRQLQFLLFEAISNVLQHAQAKTCCGSRPAWWPRRCSCA